MSRTVDDEDRSDPTPRAIGPLGPADDQCAAPAPRWRCGRFALDLARPRVMGILNATPDSFSDGGVDRSPAAGVARAFAMVEEGADLVDVGAESTRPGATPVDADAEWTRLAPILRALRDLPVPVSVDTRHAATMARALDAGASAINDVAGFRKEAARIAVARTGCGLCAMHMRGEPRTMQADPVYDDVLAEVRSFLAARVAALEEHGVAFDRIVVDPGFGFGKTLAHNVALMRGLDAIVALGRPVLVGLSRKGTVGTLTGRPVAERMPGSVAAALVALERGARIVRVHDVAATVDAIRVWSAFR